MPYVLHFGEGEWNWKNVGFDDNVNYVIETFDGKIWTETDAYPVEKGNEMYLFVTEY